MLTEQGHAKVMDFGLAKKVGSEDGREQDITSALTREGSTLGTLAYMSPEQIKAQPVDHRSDIFSFGIVLYEMLTGAHPFKKARQAETTAAVLKEDPVPLSRYIYEAPELLEHIVRKMLAKDPDERYQSAHEVRTELSEPLAQVITGSVKIAAPQKKKPSWLPVSLGVVGLILVVLLGYLSWNVLRQSVPAVEQDRKSIAVLPFDNLSASDEDEYFSDGITEDITAELAKIGDLRVMGRTSAFRFKGSDKSLGEIAGELGVATLLEGSVRRADGRVRVVAQLIDGTTEEHLWAETYDRELEDVFAIQSEVAEQIAASLKVELSSEEKRLIEKKGTENAEAYNLYLLGRHHRHIETLESLPRAVEYYQQAIALDSEFGLAYAGLSECYVVLSLYDSQEDWLQKAEESAARASALDNSIALTHIAKGIIAEERGEATTAAAEFGRAIALEPRNVDAHREYGLLLYRMGRLDDGLTVLKQAHTLDPLVGRINVNLIWIYRTLGRLDSAAEYAGEALKLNSAGTYANLYTGTVYINLAEYEKAEQYFRKALALDPRNVEALFWLVRVLLWSGQLDQAMRESRRALSVLPESRSLKEQAAVVSLWKGDYREALDLYEQSQSFGLSGRRIFQFGVARHQSEWGYALWRLGDQSAAQKLFSESIGICEEQVESGNQRYVFRSILAKVQAVQGEKDEALRWLQEAIDAGWRWYDRAQRDPLWENLRDEPRFQQMMAEVKAKVDEMHLRVEEMEKEWEE
jgi:TolB-like protein/Tfp pilus assembly protein PilF